jgi:hypothetical protein
MPSDCERSRLDVEYAQYYFETFILPGFLCDHCTGQLEKLCCPGEDCGFIAITKRQWLRGDACGQLGAE